MLQNDNFWAFLSKFVDFYLQFNDCCFMRGRKILLKQTMTVMNRWKFQTLQLRFLIFLGSIRFQPMEYDGGDIVIRVQIPKIFINLLFLACRTTNIFNQLLLYFHKIVLYIYHLQNSFTDTNMWAGRHTIKIQLIHVR